MTTSSLEAFRLSFSRSMLAVQWTMVAVVLAAALLNGAVSPLWLAPPSLVLAACVTLSWRNDAAGDWTRWLSTIALCGQVALLVLATQQSIFQIDMHMAFFAALAVAAGWACMTSILLGTAMIAVHHLVLNFAYPLAVFPDSASLSRVAVHAAILLAEAAALAWLCQRVVAAFQASDAAIFAARQSEQEVRSFGEERSTLQADVQASHARAEERILAVVGDVVAAARGGDFSHRAVVSAELGRLGTLVEGMNEINASVDRATAEFLDVLAAVAQGDLTTTVTTSFAGRFGDLAGAINQTVDKLSETVTTIQTTALDVGSSASEIQAGADDLSRRTEDQASSLEQTAATTEELAASVKASAQSSRQAVDLAEQAMKVAVDGGGIVREAVEAMARIEQASQKISDISSVIDEIAFQTNLLALNAAVEAARAGEAGKGFAVVASEVRTLAQRSSEAAKDITGLITTSNTEVAAGVRLVRSAGDVLADIVSASQKVSTTVSEISLASGEQANGIDETSQAVAHMDQMTQQNAAMAEESAASAKALTEQVAQLNDLVALFRTNRASRPMARDQRPVVAAEPHRLRQLAAEAFGARSAPKPSSGLAPKPAARKVSTAPARPARQAGGWDEF